MTRRPLAALSLVLLLITAGCLGAAPAASTAGGAATDDGSSPTVSVSATGSASVEPDLAVVTLAAEASADTAEAARSQSPLTSPPSATRSAISGSMTTP